ncbi:MAG: PIN domain-containing protein [Burkholderiaceae bacterium]|nr:PIN domain-containing protein [Burkholderiaceae bacterium]
MNFQDTLVVIDTCVLLRLRVSDVLMDLRAEGLFSAHWTENIDDEFLRNMVEVHGIPAVKAQGRLRAMKARCPEWEVTMSSADFEAVPRMVDEKDRHVAAAALALRHAMDEDTEDDDKTRGFDIVLLTENIRDMAPQPMGKLGVRVLRVGAFLDETYQAAPEATTRAVMQASVELEKPPYTVAELLYVLKEEGARTLVSRMSKTLGIKPVAK